jgi:ribonuclease VapC
MRLVVDSSALLALLFKEPEREEFHRVLLANEPVMSIANLIEAYSVTRSRLGEAALSEIDLYIETYEIEIASVRVDDMAALKDDMAALKQAMLDFGKGRGGPPAVLNFGDLFAYALAKRLGVPLLYKGNDFARTDVQPVLG